MSPMSISAALANSSCMEVSGTLLPTLDDCLPLATDAAGDSSIHPNLKNKKMTLQTSTPPLTDFAVGIAACPLLKAEKLRFLVVREGSLPVVGGVLLMAKVLLIKAVGEVIAQERPSWAGELWLLGVG